MNADELERLFERVRAGKHNAHVHVPYSVSAQREPDFEVEYELDIDPELKSIKPSQGMRCDFQYDDDSSIYMIWPELLDESGVVIHDKSAPAPLRGRAFMWIGSDEARNNIHKHRIGVGVRGYWVVGSKKIASVVVTRVIGLLEHR